jgi:hypothetical protein
MCFGWYQELLRETRARDLAAAEAELLDMLDCGGMIVHVYREADRENPELVGRHSRLSAWSSAKESGALLEQRWAVVDLYWAGGQTFASIYGKAVLSSPMPAGPSDSQPASDLSRAEI